MCEWGDTIPVLVKIPADLSYTGESRWAVKPIDKCIAPIIYFLQSIGIDMRASCCGHDKGPTIIELNA